MNITFLAVMGMNLHCFLITLFFLVNFLYKNELFLIVDIEYDASVFPRVISSFLDCRFENVFLDILSIFSDCL